jgi:cytosine/creatinine deaminase
MTYRRSNHLWYRRLTDAIEKFGGMFNAHLHLDRSGTLDEVYMQSSGHRVLDASYVSLSQKHGLYSALHNGPAYEEADFKRRINGYLDEMVAVNTTRADTVVDCTTDRVGLSAFEWMLDIKRARVGQIDFRIGAYSPLGYTDAEPGRWELLEKAAARADFIGSLPERDEKKDYPDHIGFDEHLRRVLLLAQKLNKSIHVHVDQRNEPSESATERLITAVRKHGAPVSPDGEPMVWAIHIISPSTYDDARFDALVSGMLECNIGLITCPSAALAMRQYRPIRTPTGNSIARALEMLAAGVQVRVGSDNIADICSPSTTADLIDEIFVMSAALRFYNPEILARVAAGQRLNETERFTVQEHLAKDKAEVEKFLART